MLKKQKIILFLAVSLISLSFLLGYGKKTEGSYVTRENCYWIHACDIKWCQTGYPNLCADCGGGDCQRSGCGGPAGYYTDVYQNSCTGSQYCANMPLPPLGTKTTCHYISSWYCSGSTPVAVWGSVNGSSCYDAGQPTCCSVSSWSPDPSTVCSGQAFTQTSNCGNTRTAYGTMTCIPTVDLKVNGSDNPPAVSAPAKLNVSWMTTNASQISSGCIGTGQGWNGSKNKNGGNDSGGNLNNIPAGTYTYAISCNPTDSVTIVVGSSPFAINPSVTQPNYCVTGPAATFSWTFSDPDASDTQSAYQIQVATNPGFSGPGTVIDSGKVSSASNSYATISGILTYNTKYYWRVRVWDNYDLASGWTSGANFTTPKHVYPTVNFKASPTNPSVNETVQFNDLTTGGAAIVSWLWNIADAVYQEGTNASSQNPKVKFTSTGIKNIILTAKDADNYQCANTDNTSSQKDIWIKLPLPGWKET